MISQSKITNTQWKSLHEWESETTNSKDIILMYTSYSNKIKMKTMLKEIKKRTKNNEQATGVSQVAINYEEKQVFIWQ